MFFDQHPLDAHIGAVVATGIDPPPEWTQLRARLEHYLTAPSPIITRLADAVITDTEDTASLRAQALAEASALPPGARGGRRFGQGGCARPAACRLRDTPFVDREMVESTHSAIAVMTALLDESPDVRDNKALTDAVMRDIVSEPGGAGRLIRGLMNLSVALLARVEASSGDSKSEILRKISEALTTLDEGV